MNVRVVVGRRPSLWRSATGGTRSCRLPRDSRGQRFEWAASSWRSETIWSRGKCDVQEQDDRDKQPGLLEALEALVDPVTRGDPTSTLRWTCKSKAKLAAALTKNGWRVSASSVGRMLHQLGYSLQSVRKTREGTAHPDRNKQFEHINATATKFLKRRQPVISVDTKKKNLSAISRTLARNGSQRESPRNRAFTTSRATQSGKLSRTASMTWRGTKPT